MEYLACEKPKEDGRARKATAADQSKNGMLEPWLQSKGLSDAKSRQQLQLAVAVWATVQAAPDAVFSTAATSLKPNDASDPNRVKCQGILFVFSWFCVEIWC
uniref:Uncharacterized protein n=1 Tax=Fagus sylvatica TaxID=28930 RepID=A0A2N9J9M6_FAGSY